MGIPELTRLRSNTTRPVPFKHRHGILPGSMCAARRILSWDIPRHAFLDRSKSVKLASGNCTSVKMGFIRFALLSMIVVGASIVNSSPSQSRSESGVTKRASTYWYENIAHQGIAPFAPSGYQVHRNVKDFGAVGMLNILSWLCANANLIKFQAMVLRMIPRPLTMPSCLEGVAVDYARRPH
jgi:hypothetical protein